MIPVELHSKDPTFRLPEAASGEIRLPAEAGQALALAYSRPMELDPVQVRILGCLIEKEATTPANYPLSTNALVNACNQSSNRNPVVDYAPRDVTTALLELRAEGLARTVVSGRVDKHRHVLREAWSLTEPELAVLALLFLRGPQTPGELRGRAERMWSFDTVAEVEATLEELASAPEPMVAQLARQPGQKEARWHQLVGMADVYDPEPIRAHSPQGLSSASTTGGGTTASEIEELAAEVTRLRADVDRLYELLGEKPL